MANADIAVPMVASFDVPAVHFEMNAGIYPHARIYTDKHEGYLLSFGNVSRVMLLKNSTLDLSWLKTCECVAGHIFLVRLRMKEPFKCTCGSFLSKWQSSKTCPWLHVKQDSVPVDQLEYHASLVADARKIVEHLVGSI
jgi:hypothetical protein